MSEKHYKPINVSDWFAYRFTKMLRWMADTFFKKRYGHRAVILETVAAVPGMVGGMWIHLKSLRRMRPGYGPNGRDIKWETTVQEQREHNIHVANGISKEQFVEMRTARDKTLKMPRLIIPSLQVNMKAGQVPTEIKIPVNKLK